MNLNPDFREFIALLNAHEVRYLVVGGYAVGMHGHPRYTKDLDIWIDRTPDNAERVLDALDAFGFGGIGLSVGDLTDPDSIVQLGRAPNRIDLMTTLSGVTFDECYPNRVVELSDDMEVLYIGLDDLVANKRAIGRFRDLGDVEDLGGDVSDVDPGANP